MNNQNRRKTDADRHDSELKSLLIILGGSCIFWFSILVVAFMLKK